MKKMTNLLVLLMLILFTAACGSVTAATAETPPETGTAGAALSAEKVDELIAMVNGFVASGEITGQAEKGLLAKLETIKQKALNGPMKPGAAEMGAFVNEVQAQSGKKISAAAATALIAKAQDVAEVLAGIPVTGGEGTVIPPTSQPTGSSMMGNRNRSEISPMGTQLKHQKQWDAMALQAAQSAGMSTFNYDLYQLPANSAWEDTLAYYKTQAAAAGWGDAPSQTNDMSGGHYAVWNMTGSDGTSHTFLVAQVDTSDGTYTLNLFGSK